MKKILVLAGVLFCIWPQTAHAAELMTDLTVSPAITEWLVTPGETARRQVIVTNQKDEPIPVQAAVQGMAIDEAVMKAAPATAAAWLSVDEPDVILRPKQAKRVTITLRVPKNAEPGGHYATIYFRQLAEMATRPQSYAVPRIGMLQFITVKGRVVKWLQPETLQAEAVGNGALATVGIHNTGNVHAFPSGFVILRDFWGKEVARQAVSPGLILPRTTRQFSVSWQKVPAGVYTVTTELRLGGRHLSKVSTSLWLLPIRELGGLVLVSVGVWWGIFRGRHRWKRALRVLKQG